MRARFGRALGAALLAGGALSACSTAPSSAPHPIFGAIEAIAASDNYLWVASQTGISSRSDVELTELNATTGRLIRIIPALGYDLHAPLAIAASGMDLWVSYSTAQGSIPAGPGAVAEIQDATGRKLRLFHVGGDLMEEPTAMAVGRDLWLLSSQCTYCANSGVLTEVSASTGHVEHVTNPQGFPSGIALSSGSVWIAGGDPAGSSSRAADGAVTEVSQATGAIIGVPQLRSGVPLDGGGYSDCASSGVAASRSYVWVADYFCVPVPDGSAAQISISTGRVVRSVRTSYSYYGGLTGLGDNPGAVAIAGGRVWLADADGGWSDDGVVVELDANTGRLIRVVGDQRDAFFRPVSVAVDGGVWIASGLSLTELNPQSADVMRTVSDTGHVSR